MGFFRGAGKFFGVLIFTIFLSAALFDMAIINFTTHDNLQNVAVTLLSKQLTSSLTSAQIQTVYNGVLAQCANTDKVPMNFPGINVSLNCSDVKNSNVTNFPTLIAQAIFNNVYYTNFGCSFADCVKQGGTNGLLVLISNEGNQFYQNLDIYLWIGTAVGLLLLLISAESWIGRLKLVGVVLILTALPLLLLPYLESYVMKPYAASPDTATAIKPAVDNFISLTTNYFMIALVVGIVITIVGFVLGFLSKSEKGKSKK